MIRVPRDDTSHVLVCGLDGALICKAPRNTGLGIVDESAEDVRAALREKDKLRKTSKAYRDQRPRMSHDMHRLVADAGRKRRAAERQNAAPSDYLPPSTKLVRTAVDGQLPAIQRAMSANKKAVGAENLDLDNLRPQMPRDGDSPANDDVDVFAAVSAAMRNARGES